MFSFHKTPPFKNRFLIIGFGSIGGGLLPLLLQDLGVSPEQITIVAADNSGQAKASSYGIPYITARLAQDNYRDILTPLLTPKDFLINVSVDVSSTSLIEFCQEKKVLYIDTCIEPWAGFYTNASLSAQDRSNYALRESALALRKKYTNGSTAVIAHGANPGLISHFIKQALLNIASDTNLSITPPTTPKAWALLAQQLNIKVIHIAERDTQVAAYHKKRGEFVNTWSIDGFYSEGCQPAELGWGSHEKELPADGTVHKTGCCSSICLGRPGRVTRVRSWTPLEGTYNGFLITHNESISTSDYYTLLNENGDVLYRPTCHYAYHPCDDATLSLHELNGKNGVLQKEKRLLMDEIVSGMDELGVLLLGNPKGAYWYGSRLTIEQTRARVPNNNATSLQVTSAVLAGIVWAMENPQRGIVEPEFLDFKRILEIASPYLGEIVGTWGDWTPLKDRDRLFEEQIDVQDPWQFKNFRAD